jgi:hypothetical protein
MLYNKEVEFTSFIKSIKNNFYNNKGIILKSDLIINFKIKINKPIRLNLNKKYKNNY